MNLTSCAQVNLPPAGFIESVTNTSSDQVPPHLRCGLGNCSKCKCPAYEGNANVCDNCGHSYESHG